MKILVKKKVILKKTLKNMRRKKIRKKKMKKRKRKKRNFLLSESIRNLNKKKNKLALLYEQLCFFSAYNWNQLLI
jgi:hypothetical protein